jgi:hypothetical protein
VNHDESQQVLHAQARLLSAAEDRATIWKFLAIAFFLCGLWCILDLRGCIP